MRPSALSVLAAALLACGHVSKLRPTPKGAIAAEAAFGGPVGMVESYTLPLPLLTAGASYGVHDRFDVDAHAHLTAALLGVAGVDVGSTGLLLEQGGAVPAVSLTGRLYAFANAQAFAPYFELTPVASWKLFDRYSAYVSGTALFQFLGGRPLFAVGGGGRAQLGASGLQLELRWYEPDYVSTNLPTRWYGVGPLGAWGFVLAYDYRFGGTR